MMLWLEERFRQTGASTERVAVGMFTAASLPGGRSGGSKGGGEGSVTEPGAATPALLITYTTKPAARKTVCVYCHADTRCPPPKDVCTEDPWTLRQDGDLLIGCGVYDNKVSKTLSNSLANNDMLAKLTSKRSSVLAVGYQRCQR